MELWEGKITPLAAGGRRYMLPLLGQQQQAALFKLLGECFEDARITASSRNRGEAALNWQYSVDLTDGTVLLVWPHWSDGTPDQRHPSPDRIVCLGSIFISSPHTSTQAHSVSELITVFEQIKAAAYAAAAHVRAVRAAVLQLMHSCGVPDNRCIHDDELVRWSPKAGVLCDVRVSREDEPAKINVVIRTDFSRYTTEDLSVVEQITLKLTDNDFTGELSSTQRANAARMRVAHLCSRILAHDPGPRWGVSWIENWPVDSRETIMGDIITQNAGCVYIALDGHREPVSIPAVDGLPFSDLLDAAREYVERRAGGVRSAKRGPRFVVEYPVGQVLTVDGEVS